MNPYALPQTLLLPRHTPFDGIAAGLERLGFVPSETRAATPPVITGEPELAGWTWHGGLPVVGYAFNPVVRLRSLQVATVPPMLRADIATALGALPGGVVAAALGDRDERLRLWAIWAALETERVDLVADMAAQLETAAGVVRDELETALVRLETLAEARIKMLTAGRVIAGAAMDLIAALADPDLLRSIAPTRADIAACFHDSVAEPLWAAVAQRPPPPGGLLAQPTGAAAIAAAPAGALRWPNPLSEAFPRGHRIVAGWMEPSRVWLAWRGTEPDGGTRRMEGLVFVDDHWTWLPRIWRDLEPLILQPPGRRDH